MAEPLDLSKPMNLRGEMARSGLHSLTPYEDPERGWVDPLNDREQRGLARVFLHNLWQACLRAEKAAESGAVNSAPSPTDDQRIAHVGHDDGIQWVCDDSCPVSTCDGKHVGVWPEGARS